MKEIDSYEFKKMIAQDFNLPLCKEVSLRLPNDKRLIKRFTTSVAHKVRIFDGEKEHPYMIDKSKRNDEALAKGIELRYLASRPVSDLAIEAGTPIKYKKCKISEGNGWYSEGTEYSYKDYFCQV